MLDLAPARNLKGSTGAIKDIYQIENSSQVLTCGYDRFLRLFDYKSYEDPSHFYLKNKLNVIYPYEIKPESFDEDLDDEVEDEEEEGGDSLMEESLGELSEGYEDDEGSLEDLEEEEELDEEPSKKKEINAKKKLLGKKRK